MTKLFDKETGHLVGEINEEQLQFLMENLEEESLVDDDYYFNEATLDMLKEKGADEKLFAILEKAILTKGEAELRWERE